MEDRMFDATDNVICFPENRPPATAETLKEQCLDPAAIWVLKRRAHLPYLPPQRLPAVARGG
jgi:hypothetical protein